MDGRIAVAFAGATFGQAASGMGNAPTGRSVVPERQPSRPGGPAICVSGLFICRASWNGIPLTAAGGKPLDEYPDPPFLGPPGPCAKRGPSVGLPHDLAEAGPELEGLCGGCVTAGGLDGTALPRPHCKATGSAASEKGCPYP